MEIRIIGIFEDLNKVAQDRLAQKYMEAESLISLRVKGNHRLYGMMIIMETIIHAFADLIRNIHSKGIIPLGFTRRFFKYYEGWDMFDRNKLCFVNCLGYNKI